MKDDNTTVEVAIFGLEGRYDNYEDYTEVLRTIMVDDWNTMTVAQVKAIARNRHEVANELGYNDILVLQKVDKSRVGIAMSKIDEFVKKVDDRRAAQERANEKARKKAAEKAEAKRVEKARRDFEKAKKTLEAAGQQV